MDINTKMKKVTDIQGKAINSGFTEPADFLHVYTVFCDYKHRKINWDEEHIEKVAMKRAKTCLNFKK